MIESECFTVTCETKDFAVLKLNLDAHFNGVQLRIAGSRTAILLAQHLLDEHGFLVMCPDKVGSIVCRKVKEQA